MPATKRTQRPTKGKAGAEEFDALAHHLAEALRIMGESELIPARIYNDFADALNELHNFTNSDDFCNSEPFISLHLAELARKGGAK